MADSETELDLPERDRSGMLRWLLLALGIIAIIALAVTSTRLPSKPQRAPVNVAVDTSPVEPAPLTFQPDIAPADAEALNAERADYAGPILAARPFIAPRTADRQLDLQRAIACLSQAVYYEAASETPAGQRAVAQVVLNRVRDPRYPSSVCGVVYQGSERRTGCQFTFTCDGALARKPDPFLFARARMVALGALFGQVEPLVGLATHYHTKQVVPYWRTDLVKLRTVGAHIFYGWQGREKSARGLRVGYAGIEPEILPSIDPTGLPPSILPPMPDSDGLPSPFARTLPDQRLSAPKLPERDFGRMRADEGAGELTIGKAGNLNADNQSGVLAKP